MTGTGLLHLDEHALLETRRCMVHKYCLSILEIVAYRFRRPQESGIRSQAGQRLSRVPEARGTITHGVRAPGIQFGTLLPSSTLDRFAPGPLAGLHRSTARKHRRYWSCGAARRTPRGSHDLDARRRSPDGRRRAPRTACENITASSEAMAASAAHFTYRYPVDADRMTADLHDGVLTVTCPKAPNGGGRRIHIT